jgi:hypothetical protein
MQGLQARYAASGTRLDKRLSAAKAASGVDISREANELAERFAVFRKKRAPSQYADIARHLLEHYPAEVGYFIAVEINEQFESSLGYPPVGQMMMAMEAEGGEGAARWIACALRNFPRVETAKLAFSVIRSPGMRSLVRDELARDDSSLAEYIASGEMTATQPSAKVPPIEASAVQEPKNAQILSDGIERMPRRLTEAEHRGDKLFFHLQVASFGVLILFPILGGALRGWIGAGIGFVVGWIVRSWIRRSMGVRGSNPNESFFIRMRERAKGARPGMLEILIERVRQRTFTQRQCAEITEAWDQTRLQMEAAKSIEEKRQLMEKLDSQIKRISYGHDG